MKRIHPLRPTTPGRQRGAALLVFMLIFFLASASWMLSQANNPPRFRRESDQATSMALAQAKEALIGRALKDKERPGSLPCPDFDDDGEATNGSCSITIGRLPWKTLGLPDLRDGEGNRLWYALAGELRDNDTTPPINPTVSLELSLDGTANIAAIVFSAGPPLAGQNGRPGNAIDDYLDGANKDGGPYVSGPPLPAFNDKTIAISHDQLFRIVDRGILGRLGAGLEKFYVANADRYPAEGIDLKTALDPYLDTATKTMLDTNEWYAITTYAPAPNRKSATLAITVQPATTPTTTCTIAPEQKPVCTHP